MCPTFEVFPEMLPGTAGRPGELMFYCSSRGVWVISHLKGKKISYKYFLPVLHVGTESIKAYILQKIYFKGSWTDFCHFCQYDDRLFIEVQYMKIPCSNLERTCCVQKLFDIQNNFCTQLVLPMFCKKKSFCQRFTCTEVNHCKSNVFFGFPDHIWFVN